MRNQPLVSVICLSYNHQRFIREALDSVLEQTYPNIEIIIVDDCSTDNSVEIIKEYTKDNPKIKFIELQKNIGNCKAFNKGFKQSEGKYLIDFSMDDVMMPERVQAQVDAFEKLSDNYAVVFTDAIYISENSQTIRNHYLRQKTGDLKDKIPEGDVYKDVLEKYFICTPTMMIRSKSMQELNGYDESLSYEDFDFWVRASRQYKFKYLDEILCAKRIVKGSHSTKFTQLENSSLHKSTLEVCKKALALNKNQDENNALAKRIRYEMRQTFFTKNYRISLGYARLLRKMNMLKGTDIIISRMSKRKLDLSKIYKAINSSKPKN